MNITKDKLRELIREIIRDELGRNNESGLVRHETPQARKARLRSDELDYIQGL